MKFYFHLVACFSFGPLVLYDFITVWNKDRYIVECLRSGQSPATGQPSRHQGLWSGSLSSSLTIDFTFSKLNWKGEVGENFPAGNETWIVPSRGTSG